MCSIKTVLVVNFLRENEIWGCIFHEFWSKNIQIDFQVFNLKKQNILLEVNWQNGQIW